MKRTSLSRILCGLLAFAVSCGVAVADIGAQVPQFSTQSLDGQRFDDVSLRGRVVLLEFWATWCPHCREDQAAVNNLARRYSGQGLVVSPVDVGKNWKEQSRKFLAAHPSTCPWRSTKTRSSRRASANTASPTMSPSTATDSLPGRRRVLPARTRWIAMLSLAGLDQHSGTPPLPKTLRSEAPQPIVPLLDTPGPDAQPGGESGSSAAAVPSGPKIIELPPAAPAPRSTRARHAPPPKPARMTIFVLASGERADGRLHHGSWNSARKAGRRAARDSP